MEEKNVNQLIKESFASLSPGQKKVAEYIQSHRDDGALLTAYQIGKKASVSETTVIRFAYALGFAGFSNLQDKIRKEWLADKQPSSIEVSAAQEDGMELPLFETVIEREKALLDQLLKQVNQEDLWEAVDALIAADTVYIGGFGSSYAAGYWLFYSLRQLRANVMISSPNDLIPEDIQDLTERSVVVIFSYPRYRKESLKLVTMAKNQKSKILAITNRQLSPIGQVANITITTEEKVDSSHNSIASVISLLEVLIAGIQEKDQERISRRQQKLEQLYSKQKIFIE